MPDVPSCPESFSLTSAAPGLDPIRVLNSPSSSCRVTCHFEDIHGETLSVTLARRAFSSHCYMMAHTLLSAYMSFRFQLVLCTVLDREQLFKQAARWVGTSFQSGEGLRAPVSALLARCCLAPSHIDGLYYSHKIHSTPR